MRFSKLTQKLFVFFLVSFHVSSLEAAEVLSVFPTGSVKQVQQVTARFSADMVAMGDPKAKASPFTLKCNSLKNKKEGEAKEILPAHTTRWVDSKNWSLDFDKPLQAGVQCSLQLNPIKDLAGEELKGLKDYTFSTSGPAILYAVPRYDRIEPDQYFVFELDGRVDRQSVEKLAYFEVGGFVDKVNVKLIEGKERETVIKAALQSNWFWDDFKEKLKDKKANFALVFENFLVVKASRRFPEKSKVVFHWPQGILSRTGMPVTEPQSFDFEVIPDFEALFSCQRTAAEKPCNPITAMEIEFTRPVPVELLKSSKLVSSTGKTWIPKELDPQQAKTQKADQELSRLTFEGPFPEKATFSLQIPKGIKDQIGRALKNEGKYPLKVTTDEYSPLVKFAANFGILELNADPALPVSLRNVEKQLPQVQMEIEGKALNLSGNNPKDVIQWYRKIQEKSWDWDNRGRSVFSGSQGAKLKLPKPNGAREFELVGIPLKKPGFYVVELASPKLGQALLDEGTMYVSSSALVTNLAVHLKRGREKSLVWVTRLDNAQPVEGADVALFNDEGQELAKGKTGKDGMLWLDRIKNACKEGGPETEDGPSVPDSCEIFTFAKLGEDFSFASSRWAQGIEDYRFNLTREYLSPMWGPVVAHTVFDRSLVKAGEAVNMKHFLRDHTSNGFRMIHSKVVPKRVLVVHNGTQKVYSFPFAFDAATGTALTKFEVPKEASLGVYSVYLSNQEKSSQNAEGEGGGEFDWSAKSTGTFVVSEYRLPLMDAKVKVQGDKLVQPSEVPVDLSASYLSGGPALGLKVKLRSSLSPEYFTPEIPGSDQMSFFSEPLKPGVRNYDENPNEIQEEKFLQVQDLALEADGGKKAVIKGLPPVKKVTKLSVEMEYRDPNGEVKTAAATKTLFPANYIIGLGSENWISKPGQVTASGVITNTSGKPLKGKSFVVEAFKNEFYSHRKRLVGGFYSYDYRTEVLSLGKVCEGKSDDYGRFQCAAKDMQPGSITLQAKVTDEKGRSTYAQTSVYVFGKGADSWWVPSDSDRIDVLPEKVRYEPNEKAKIMVRTPFPVATALVSVEREGVLDAFVQEVTREKPFVELPLKGNYAPNVFVSVFLVRGRVGEPQATALLDLARPAMKLGISEIKVGWKAHELKVSVKPEKKRYQTREKAQITIQVKTASGVPLPAGAEVAVAAVDEALLSLRSNQSVKLLEAMMGQRGLEVDTSSAQNQVIGKRHFGSKAKPPGGGGGISMNNTRELFDPLLLWEPKLKTDTNGEVKVTVPLNDSLTTFRIIAVAHAGADFFGDGFSKIESTKDLILYSGLAPLVREGDQIRSAVTVRNTTSAPMSVTFEITSPQLAQIAVPAVVELKANAAQTLEIPMNIPENLEELQFQIVAKDQKSNAQDSLKTSIKVLPSLIPQVQQATLLQLEQTAKIPVRQPDAAIAGKGSLQVQAQTTLVRGLAGVKSFMEDYPYTCLEQQVSRAVSLEQKEKLQKIVLDLPSYMDSSGLLKFFPSSVCGSSQLTRYVLNIFEANRIAIPEETLTPLLEGLKKSLNGSQACKPWWSERTRNTYVDQERLLLMEVLSRYQTLDPKELTSIQITPNLWKTETVTALFQILKREKEAPNRDALLKQTENILRARVNFQGSLMNLQNDLDWEGEWRLFSSKDQEALNVFAIAISEPSWSQDAGRMARGVVARLKKGIWDTTMANAWGVTYMRKFSETFEKEKVAGETKISTPDGESVINWMQAPEGGRKSVAWPKGSEKTAVPVTFTHSGAGKPWIHFETVSVIPLKAPVDLGYKVSRKVTPVSQATPGKWRSGDVANVEITVTAKAEHPWVVVRDPIPAGASHLGTGLEGSSAILDRAPKAGANAGGVEYWPSEFDEKSQGFFTTYAAYLPRGTYKLNYRIRLNSSGEFHLPPTRVEAMYARENFGETPNEKWTVAP